MTDIFSGDAIFTELIHQRACKNVVEEKVHVFHDHTLRRLIPFGAPKNSEDLDGSEQRPAAVSKPGRDRRCNALRLRAMKWHDADRVLRRGGRFPGTRLGGHEALLVQADGFALRWLGRQTGWSSHGTERCEKCKWDFVPEAHAAGVYSGSGCGIVPIRTRGDSMSAPVKVQIFGQTYSIQGELDGKYVQKLAKYVDEKMHDIADVTKTVDTQKVAVLAALAIADELHNMQRDRGDHEQLMREQAERCLTLVERALKQTA